MISVLDFALRLNEIHSSARDQGHVQIAAALLRPTTEKRIAPTGRRRRRLNKAQQSKLRNVVGFSSVAHSLSDEEREQDEDDAAQEEAEILRETTVDYDDAEPPVNPNISSRLKGDESSIMPSQSQFSSFFADAPVLEKVEKVGAELDVVVRYIMQQVESSSGGGGRNCRR